MAIIHIQGDEVLSEPIAAEPLTGRAVIAVLIFLLVLQNGCAAVVGDLIIRPLSNGVLRPAGLIVDEDGNPMQGVTITASASEMPTWEEAWTGKRNGFTRRMSVTRTVDGEFAFTFWWYFSCTLQFSKDGYEREQVYWSTNSKVNDSHTQETFAMNGRTLTGHDGSPRFRIVMHPVN